MPAHGNYELGAAPVRAMGEGDERARSIDWILGKAAATAAPRFLYGLSLVPGPGFGSGGCAPRLVPCRAGVDPDVSAAADVASRWGTGLNPIRPPQGARTFDRAGSQ
jgi:hypothetical protein